MRYVLRSLPLPFTACMLLASCTHTPYTYVRAYGGPTKLLCFPLVHLFCSRLIAQTLNARTQQALYGDLATLQHLQRLAPGSDTALGGTSVITTTAAGRAAASAGQLLLQLLLSGAEADAGSSSGAGSSGSGSMQGSSNNNASIAARSPGETGGRNGGDGGAGGGGQQEEARRAVARVLLQLASGQVCMSVRARGSSNVDRMCNVYACLIPGGIGCWWRRLACAVHPGKGSSPETSPDKGKHSPEPGFAGILHRSHVHLHRIP